LELAFELRSRFKQDRINSVFPRRVNVHSEIVGEKALGRVASSARDGFGENLGRRFRGADLVGQHAMMEVPQQRIIRLDHLEMDGVRIRKNHQAMAASKSFQQRLLYERLGEKDTGPDGAELVVVDRELERAGKLADEFARRDPAGFVAEDEVGCPEALRDFGDVVVAERLKPAVGAFEIKRHDRVAKVEEDGFDHCGCRRSANHFRNTNPFTDSKCVSRLITGVAC